jgi:hypothetical protein
MTIFNTQNLRNYFLVPVLMAVAAAMPLVVSAQLSNSTLVYNGAAEIGAGTCVGSPCPPPGGPITLTVALSTPVPANFSGVICTPDWFGNSPGGAYPICDGTVPITNITASAGQLGQCTGTVTTLAFSGSCTVLSVYLVVGNGVGSYWYSEVGWDFLGSCSAALAWADSQNPNGAPYTETGAISRVESTSTGIEADGSSIVYDQTYASCSISGPFDIIDGISTSPGTWVFQSSTDQLSIANAGSGQPVAGWVSGDTCGTGTTCASGAPATRVPFRPNSPINGLISLNANYIADPNPLLHPNEVVAFTRGQLPQYVSLPQPPAMPTWTLGSDTIPVNFAPPVTLPIQFWDASTSPIPARTLATAGLAYANSFYFNQNAGIKFQEIGYEPIPGAPFNAVQGLSTLGCAHVTPTGVLAGWQAPQALNVYITDVIAGPDGSLLTDTSGLSCGGAVILGALQVAKVSAMSGELQTLAHEIGHELSLAHPAVWIENTAHPDDSAYGPPWTGFNMSDLMWPYWNHRVPPLYITSGQTFRMTFDSRSILNNGGGLTAVEGDPVSQPKPFSSSPLRSPSLPTFACDIELGSPGAPGYPAQCPSTCKDVWGVDTASATARAAACQ